METKTILLIWCVIALPLIGFFVWRSMMADERIRAEMHLETSVSDVTHPRKISQNPVPLSVQLDKLAEVGIHLKPGVTIDDFLFSFPEEEYENAPYDIILFVLAGEIEREPWGR